MDSSCVQTILANGTCSSCVLGRWRGGPTNTKGARTNLNRGSRRTPSTGRGSVAVPPLPRIIGDTELAPIVVGEVSRPASVLWPLSVGDGCPKLALVKSGPLTVSPARFLGQELPHGTS